MVSEFYIDLTDFDIGLHSYPANSTFISVKMNTLKDAQMCFIYLSVTNLIARMPKSKS